MVNLKAKSMQDTAYQIDKTSVLYGLFYLMQSKWLPAILQNTHQSPQAQVLQVAAFQEITLGKLLPSEEERNAFVYMLTNTYGKTKNFNPWNDLLKLPVSNLVNYICGDMDRDDIEDALDSEEGADESVQAFITGFLKFAFKDPSFYAIGLEKLDANVNNFLVDVLNLNFGVMPGSIEGTVAQFSKTYGAEINSFFNKTSKKGKKQAEDEDDLRDIPSKSDKKPYRLEKAEEVIPDTLSLEDVFDTAVSHIESKISRRVSSRRDANARIDKIDLSFTIQLSRFTDDEKREEARQLIFKLARLS